MNVWIAEVSAKRKHCPNCLCKIEADNSIVSVGEYVRGNYRKGFHACGECIVKKLDSMIGTKYTLKVRSGCSVRWLKG